MHPWIRLYRSSLHNPKIVSLNDRQHRVWCNCLLIADDDGFLPKGRDIACHLRTTIQDAEQTIADLVDAGLIDIEGCGPARKFVMHDWRTHQYVSDSSTERVRKFRRSRGAAGSGTPVKRFTAVAATPPEPDSETDSESEPSTQRAMRGAGSPGFKNLDLGQGSRAVSARLKARAEGLGLPVAEMLAEATMPHVVEPNAMFRAIAKRRLQEMLPRADERMLAAALTKNDAAYASVNQLILETI